MILGIDPGKSGAACFMYDEGKIVGIIPFANTELDIYEDFNGFSRGGSVFAFIEKVHAMPKQGVSSTFKFGKQYGFILGLLTALKIPYEFITPQKWQKAMGCLSHGDKNITKGAVQRLFPEQKITHQIADSILIAEYGRRIFNQRKEGNGRK